MGQLLPPGLGLPWYRTTSSPSSDAAGLEVSMTMHNSACLHPLLPFLRAFLPDVLHLESSSI